MTSEAAGISIKIPPFWAEQPALWFAQVEAQFLVAGITQDATKFGHVVGKLEGRYAIEVVDIITAAPPNSGKYDKLKAELIVPLSESQEKKLK